METLSTSDGGIATDNKHCIATYGNIAHFSQYNHTPVLMYNTDTTMTHSTESAVASAHTASAPHRRLKPSNQKLMALQRMPKLLPYCRKSGYKLIASRKLKVAVDLSEKNGDKKRLESQERMQKPE
eukprot:Platyproteum_vivax@DN4313_c0_g1_i1.p2